MTLVESCVKIGGRGITYLRTLNSELFKTDNGDVQEISYVWPAVLNTAYAALYAGIMTPEVSFTLEIAAEGASILNITEGGTVSNPGLYVPSLNRKRADIANDFRVVGIYADPTIVLGGMPIHQSVIPSHSKVKFNRHGFVWDNTRVHLIIVQNVSGATIPISIQMLFA